MLALNILIILLLVSCIPDYSTKFYNYYVENQFVTQNVKLVPLTESNFWITKADTFIVTPMQKIYIGTRMEYDKNEKASDIYQPTDIIELFDIYINNVKQEKDFTQRLSWTFTSGLVDETAIYTLILNENTIN